MESVRAYAETGLSASIMNAFTVGVVYAPANKADVGLFYPHFFRTHGN